MKKIYTGTFKILISILIGGVFMIFSAFWYFSHDLPDFKKLSNYEPSVLSRVYDDKGNLIAEYALEKRLFIPFESIPDKVINSFLSSEDRNFFDHPGIDARGVTRAFIRNIQNISELLDAGADKVSINTAAIENPDLIKDSSSKFGSQCIVVAIDAKKVHSGWNVFTYGGRNDTGINAIEWAQKCVDFGAGEILLTSMDMDGNKKGYDVKLLNEVSSKVSVPVIASGGAGRIEDLHDAIVLGLSDAVLAATIFHYGEISIKEVKEFFKSKGIPVRL